MRPTPDDRIRAVCEPDEVPSVVFVASRFVRVVCSYALWLGGVVLLGVVSPGWSWSGVVIGIALLFLMNLRWLNGRFVIGVVGDEGDVVVVHDRGWWGLNPATLVGRWSWDDAAVELLDGRRERIRIAGTTYGLNDKESVRARLAISAAKRLSSRT